MATLDSFAGPHSGKMQIYVYGWINNYVGTGAFTTFDTFQAAFSGHYDYLGFKGEITVSLELTDRNPAATYGPCTVTLLGNTDHNASYQVNGQYLTIDTTLNSKPFNIYSRAGGTEFADLDIPNVGSAGIWIGPGSADPRRVEQKLAAEVSKLEQEVLQIKETYEPGLMRLPNVHGVSLGYKRVKGIPTSQLAICVHVSQKVPANVLMPSELVPPYIHGVPTDVIEHPPLSPQVEPDTAEYRPLVGGCQLLVNEKLGTLGCIAVDSTSGSPVHMVLSNQHVLQAVGNNVYQPGPKGTYLGDVVRTVLSDHVDGGIAGLGSINNLGYVIDFGYIQGTYFVTAQDITGPGYPVYKRGRTTLTTAGYITNIHFSGTRNDGWNFQDQHLIRNASVPFSQAGDSGSVIINITTTQDPVIVSLLWGGDEATVSGASPIQNVMSELNITLFTAGLTDPKTLLAAPMRWHPNYEAWLKRIITELSITTHGRPYANIIQRYEPVVRDLVEKKARVGAVWKLNQGEAILGAAMDWVENSRLVVPREMNGLSTGHALEQIKAALVKYGNEDLEAALETMEPFFRSCADKRWWEILKNLDADKHTPLSR